MKAMLLLDPERYTEQRGFVAERGHVLAESGDGLWVEIDEALVERLVGQGIQVQPFEANDRIELPALVFEPRDGEPRVPPALAAPANTHYWIVQTVVPADETVAQALAELGAQLLAPVPRQAAVYAMDSAHAGTVRDIEGVAWVGPYHPAYAMSYALAGRSEPFDAQTIADARGSVTEFPRRPAGSLAVHFFADVELTTADAALRAAGAEVVGMHGEAWVCNSPAAGLEPLLRVPGVRELAQQGETGLTNLRAGVILGANQVRNFGNVDFLVNLDGQGEIVGIFDTGLDNGALVTTHTDFADAAAGSTRVLRSDNLNVAPVVLLPATPTDVNGHGTHVAGSIGGDGRNSAPGLLGRGVAPACRLMMTSVNNFVLPAPANPPLNFGAHLQAVQNHYAGGARVHSNSWRTFGNNIYTANSSALDRLAWLRPDLLVVFASGNDEGDFNNTGTLDQNTLSQQACAKNVLTIGATENVTALDGDARHYLNGFTFMGAAFNCGRWGTTAGSAVFQAATLATPFSISDNAQDVVLFSNRGRVRNPVRPAKRRVKPELVAPGTNVVSVRSSVSVPIPAIGQGCPPPPVGVPNPALALTSAPVASYVAFSGTSMATPLASGCAALVRQFYRQRFGQLRRPALVQAVPQFVDRPAAIARADRRVLAWVRRDVGAARNDIVAALYDTQAAPDGAIVVLATGVGDQPAPALALHGNTTLLLWRDGAGALKLAAFDAALAPVVAFGTNGVVTVNAAVRTEPDRRPTLCVQANEAGVAWIKAADDDVLFQRFNPGTGAAIDAAPVRLGAAKLTSPHPWLQHDGTRWAAFWAGESGAGGVNKLVQLRFVNADGTAAGARALNLVSQPDVLGAPHAVFDAVRGMWLVAYHSTAPAARGILALRVSGTGAALGFGPERPVPLAVDARWPRLHLHPDHGFVLLWEDVTQNASFDVYLAFLDSAGAAGPVSRLQISDTPNATEGFAAVVDGNGVVPVWQSNDEANGDVLGIYLLGVGKNGVFAAQQDAATPLLDQQFYTRQTLLEQPEPSRVAVAMCWAGGDFYFLRHSGLVFMSDLELVHTSADGVPDAAFGAGGARRIEREFAYEALSLAWTGSLIAASSSHGPNNSIYLLQSTGAPATGFGTQGVVSLGEASAATVYGQIASDRSGAALRLFVAFGQHDNTGSHHLRYTVRSRAGAVLVAHRTLARAAGTAKQGWFHWLATETPQHSIAAWHAPTGAPPLMQVLMQRFAFNGTAQAGQPAPVPLTAAPGEAMNATLAPRPVQFAPAFPVTAADLAGSRQREFGAAWQHLSPGLGARSQIWFSRLTRTGVPVATVGQFDVIVVNSATDHATEPQLVWHGDGYGLAWLQQPVGGGNHMLVFTVLDQNGQRPDLAASAAPAPATDFAITTVVADVQRFHLVWTGASFRITWTELEGTRLLHRQRGIALPRPASSARYDAPFQQPSAALIKATLINGATNLRNTALPNIGNNVNDGYGWGRINLRQSLAPAQPVSFHVRDDATVGPGRRIRYALRIKRDTQLLRVTLAWTDPPGADLVNHLHLRVTTPAFAVGGVQVFHGNRFRTDAGNTHLSRRVTAPEPAFEDTHTVQQVVLAAPPSLPEGEYIVEVICSALTGGAFQQFPGQPFALVVVGSGPELRTAANPAAAPVGIY
jgi:serine protease AprX